jgi:hypothetical protein
MKIIKILLVSSILLLAQFAAHSQYKPFLAQGSNWYNYLIGFGVNENGHSSIVTDSTINNLTYKLIDVYGNSQEFCLMREDTSTRKVYILDQAGAEILAYDFNLQLGDTFNAQAIGDPGLAPHTLTLDSITSTVTIPGGLQTAVVYHSSPRVFYLSRPNDPNPVIWVEGIGSISGFYAFYRTYYDTGILLCHYFGASQQDYHNSFFSQDSLNCEGILNLGMVSNPILDLQYSIYPNPATSKITIDVTLLGGNEPITMQIVDILGRTVHSESIQLQTSSYTVNTSEWKPGIYSVIFSDGNKRSTQKVIITTQ